MIAIVPPVAPWRLGRHLGRARAADRVADRPLLARERDAALGGASWRRARTRGRGASFYRGEPFRLRVGSAAQQRGALWLPPPHLPATVRARAPLLLRLGGPPPPRALSGAASLVSHS